MRPSSADHLFQLANGFAATAVLDTAIRLKVFATLHHHGHLTSGDLAAELGLPARPAEQFLAACASLGLTAVDSRGRHHNTDIAAHYLVPGRPGYLGDFVHHLRDRAYPAWHRLATALQSDRPVTWQPDEQRSRLFDPSDPDTAALISAIYPMAVLAGTQLAQLPLWENHHALLDIGGGSGGYSIGLCQSLTELTATVYDLDHVITDITRRFVGGHDRISLLPGDFLTDPTLPTGHDVALLANILHDWGPDTRTLLLAKARTALPPGGAIIVIEHMLDDDLLGPAQAAIMGLNMIVETEGGRSYTPGDHAAALNAAGFTDIRTHPTDLPTGNYVLTATVAKP
ncbi:methyltransferase [Streptomyces sp. NPDC004435]|uniref:methyltransferase n=1 Tax=Streptomyces sp. NPDC004435 TaxID=3364701 RepID=UPI003673B21B